MLRSFVQNDLAKSISHLTRNTMERHVNLLLFLQERQGPGPQQVQPDAPVAARRA